MTLMRCQVQGDRGESRERDGSEKNIESELKGIKTGNKTIHKKFILFVKSQAECDSNGDTPRWPKTHFLVCLSAWVHRAETRVATRRDYSWYGTNARNRA